MRVVLWGTRGAITTPGPAKVNHGANTACVTVSDGDRMLILDGGIGIIPLAERIMATRRPGEKQSLHLLMSHLHWDHVIGLPFFTPVFIPSFTLAINGRDAGQIASTTDRLFSSTYSPIKGTKNLGAELVYRGLDPGHTRMAGFEVSHTELSHPGGSMAFRIQSGERAVVYATDHEAGDRVRDEGLVELSRGADILVHDAQWTLSEREQSKGFGHSSWRDAVVCGLAAGVGTLVLFHHHPHHDDLVLEEMGRQAAAMAGSRMDVLVARDGMIIEP